MKISEYLPKELILLGITPKDKENLYEVMVDRLVETKYLNPARKRILIDKLLEREALASTGIGGGIAIPHASGENIEQMIIVFAQVAESIEYEAIDNNAVEIVFMIIGSERVQRVHLKLLANIVRACKNIELIKKLKTASSWPDVYSAVEGFDKDNGNHQ